MRKFEIAGSVALLSILVMLFGGCGSRVASGSDDGGTTLEVIACSGTVRDTLGNGVADVQVIARSVFMTGTGDSIVHVDSALSLADGSFRFDSLPKGTYVITANTSSVCGQSISSGDSAVVMTLKKTHTLYGRIFTETEDSGTVFRVEVPGTEISCLLDTNGFYTLAGVPEGRQQLVVTNGKIINYLPIGIPETSGDTVFIRDVRMVIDTGRVASSYSPFPTGIARTFSVVPMFYKPGSEPPWYKKYDFSTVDYFTVSTTGTLLNYTPSMRQILHIGRLGVDDELIINRMVVAGYTVVHHFSSAVEEKDTAGCDLIFAASTVNLAVQGPLFKNAPIPIVTSSSDYGIELGMVGSASLVTTGSLKIVGTDSIAGSFAGTVSVTSQPIAMEYGTVGSGVTKIAVDPTDSTKALIYLYESGSPMVGRTAPALRIGTFTARGCASVMNENGWALFDRVIVRALNK